MSIKHRSFRVLGCYLLLAVLSLATLSVRANSTEKDASSCRDYGQIRSRHLLFGLPKVKVSERFNIKQKDGQVIEGISILVRDGFVIGHNDKRKVPAWTSKRWNRDDLNETKIHKSRFAFQSDSDLPEYARSSPQSYARAGFDRGHLVSPSDNNAWGEASVRRAFLMSNVAPQAPQLNRRIWLLLEREHKEIVNNPKYGIEEIWIIAGTVFEENAETKFVSDGVGIPDAFFKIVAWFNSNGTLEVRSYLFPQNSSSKDLTSYLTTLNEIECKTGLCFFPLMPEAQKMQIMNYHPSDLWGKPILKILEGSSDE